MTIDKKENFIMMSLYTSQSCNNYIKNTKQNYINQNLMELKREIEN